MSQPNTSVETAFETLRSSLERAVETAWENVDDARRSKNPDGVQNALDRVRSLDQLLQQLAAFRTDFRDCVNLTELVVLPSRQPPVNRTEKHVVRRTRAHGLDITPREEYYQPILETLVDLGGRAKTAVVLDRLDEKLQHRLTTDDRALLPEGGSIRWRNHAQWARLEMVKEGLLRQGSPNGIWEVAAEGRAWLEKCKNHYS